MSNTAVLIIDFINDIAHIDGKIAASAKLIKERNVIENANRVIAYARQNKLPIAFVKVGFHQHYPECPKNSPVFSKAMQMNALQLDTWGTEFHADLDYQNDLMIVKHRVSAFYSTSLEVFLRANQIDTIIISGVSTDMAVQTTAREAHDRDYKVIIVGDACCSGTIEAHEATLKLLERISTVIDVNHL